MYIPKIIKNNDSVTALSVGVMFWVVCTVALLEHVNKIRASLQVLSTLGLFLWWQVKVFHVLLVAHAAWQPDVISWKTPPNLNRQVKTPV